MSCRLARAVAALSVVLAGFGAAAAPGDPGWLPDFRPDDWHASWIWHRPVQGLCHRYFRRSFRLDDPGRVTRAIFQWASDDGAEVLVNGNHALQEKWKMEQSLIRTREKRPDLWEKWVSKHGGAE